MKHNKSVDKTQTAQPLHYGGLAQLARASALHAEGHRFDSDILHNMPVWRNDSVYNY